MDDWQSIDATGVPPASGMEQELEPPEESRPSDPEQIRLKLPSGSTLHIREIPVEKLQEAAPPAAAASEAAAAEADSGRLWRAIVTNRRWNSTVQMLQNKLRQEERGANILRDAFTAAAEDFVLPGRLSPQELEAKISHLASSGAEQWSTWLEQVVERLRKPEKPTKQGQPSPADAELIEQAKTTLLFAVCCVYGPRSEDAEMSFESEAQLVSVPATLQVVVKGQATLAFATTLLNKLVNEANLGYFDSVTFDMDLKDANRRHAELQTLAKQAARERQLYGRRRRCKSDGDSEPLSAPCHAVVACTFTLRGSDSSVLKQMGDQAAQALRAEAAKRRREELEEEGGGGRGKMKQRKKKQAARGGGGAEGAQDKPTKLAAALAGTLLTYK